MLEMVFYYHNHEKKGDVEVMNVVRTSVLGVLLALSADGVSASPSVTDVSVSPDGGSVLKVSYKLTGGPAIVTVDVLTNGASFGGFPSVVPTGCRLTLKKLGKVQ